MAILITPRVTHATAITAGSFEITGNGGLLVNPANASDSKVHYQIQNSDKFVMGVDETNDNFVISRGGALGTNNALSIDGSNGTVSIGSMSFSGMTWDGNGIPVSGGGTGLTTVNTDSILTGNGASALSAETTFTYSSGELKILTPTNDANPFIRVGAVDAESAQIQAVFDSGGQTLDKLVISTATADAGADEGRVEFDIDGVIVLVVADTGLRLNRADTAGDVTTEYQQGATTAYVMGIDDSDSNKFKIHSGTALVDDSDIEVDTSGNVTIKNGTLTLNTALTYANGGTGQSTYAQGDLIHASASNTLAKLTIGTPNQQLRVGAGGILEYFTPATSSGVSVGQAMAFAIVF
tara:strand:- start:341 stop:1396 length:1056 start_codon:yes stop_codon:yes gene_type:complete